MSELWRAKCIEKSKRSPIWKVGDIVVCYENGLIKSNNGKTYEVYNNNSFEDWQRNLYSKWELIQPNQPALTQEEVIELFFELYTTKTEKYANIGFTRTTLEVDENKEQLLDNLS